MDDCFQLRSGDDACSAAESSEWEARRSELRAAVELGIEDIKAGRVADLEAALDRIEAMLDELEGAKRTGG